MTIEPFAELPARGRAKWESAALEVGRVQGLPTTVRYGRVFQAKRSKVPFNDR